MRGSSSHLPWNDPSYKIGMEKINRRTEESTGKKVEVVWACDEKRGTLRRKEGDGNESTGEKEERKT